MTDEAPRRRPRSLLWRIGPVVVGLSVAVLLQRFYGRQPVELLVSIPPASDDGSALDVRITRAKDSKLVLEVDQTERAPKGHTVVIHTKLPRGHYVVQAWLENKAHTDFDSRFDFQGDNVVDVVLTPRPAQR